MTVRANMKSGSVVDLAPSQGLTPRQVIEGLTQNSLTGSAVPLAEVWLETEDGAMIRYADVETLEIATDERPTV